MKRQFIGVDIGGTSIKLGSVDNEGTIIDRMEIEYRDMMGDKTVMNIVVEGIRDFTGGDISGFSGIGVSAAGCIDSVTGKVAENGGNIPGWSREDICGRLREEFGIGAAAANDANCALLGELWSGAANGYNHVIGVTVGTGVGGGIITNGRLLEGARGFGGEIGHTPTHAGGIQCKCGIQGCFERYASTSALIRTAVDINPEWDSGRKLFAAASENDEMALKVIDDWIDEVAAGVAGLIHIFNPELVLIGGGVSHQKELFVDPLKDKVLSMIMPDFRDGLEFRPAALGNNAGIIGAVYYYLSKENYSRFM